jgi:PmbA protein
MSRLYRQERPRSFGDDFMNLPADFQRAVRRLESAGAQWEFWRETIWRQRVRVKRGAADLDYRLHECGVALRVIHRQRPAFVFRSPSDPASLEQAAREALDQAGVMKPGAAHRFAPVRPLPSARPVPPPDAAAQLTEQARAMEHAAAGGGVQPRDAVAECERRALEIWNSNGLSGSCSLDAWSLSLEVTAQRSGGGKREEKRQALGECFAPDTAGLSAARFGRALAQQAKDLLGATAPRPGLLPVVLAADCAVDLFEAFAPLYNAEDAAAGRTLAATPDRLQHGNPEAWLHDDPAFPGGYGPQPFDGEGTPAARVTLSAPDQPPALLHTLETAVRARRSAPGTALRGSLRALPAPASRYLVIPAGRVTRRGLLRGAEGGILITALYGLHTVDLLTGEFALSASGFRIKAGALAEPLAGFTVSGD